MDSRTACGIDKTSIVSSGGVRCGRIVCLHAGERPRWMFRPRWPLKYFLQTLHRILFVLEYEGLEVCLTEFVNLNDGMLTFLGEGIGVMLECKVVDERNILVGNGQVLEEENGGKDDGITDDVLIVEVSDMIFSLPRRVVLKSGESSVSNIGDALLFDE